MALLEQQTLQAQLLGLLLDQLLATSQLGPLHLGLLLQQVHLEVQIRTSHLLVPIQQELLVRVHPILLEVVLTALLVNQLQDLVLLVGHLVAIRTLEEQVVVYLGRAVMLFGGQSSSGFGAANNSSPFGQANQTTHLVVQTIIHHLVKAIRNNSQGLFGSGTGNAFGSNTGGSTFGSNNTGFGAGGNAFGQQGNTGFGANKPVTTGFGSSTSGGLFGQQSQQQQPGATGGLFGQNQQQQQMQEVDCSVLSLLVVQCLDKVIPTRQVEVYSVVNRTPQLLVGVIWVKTCRFGWVIWWSTIRTSTTRRRVVWSTKSTKYIGRWIVWKQAYWSNHDKWWWVVW